MKLSYFTTVLAILLQLVAMLLVYNKGIFTSGADKISNSFGIYLPILSIVFSILAARFIGKDENTMRGMDRLR